MHFRPKFCQSFIPSGLQSINAFGLNILITLMRNHINMDNNQSGSGKNVFTQTGKLSIAIMLPILIFCLVMVILSIKTDLFQTVFFSILALIFLATLITFYKLTITVDSDYVSFTLGPGIISKKYPFEDIRSCRPVKNSPLAGVGIKLIPNGWLYNVSGSYAVELAFRNSKSVVRIGTDRPEEVSELINSLLKTDAGGSENIKKGMGGLYLTVILLVITLAFPAILLYTGGREPRIETGPDSFTISGMYGLSVKYSDILKLDTANTFPAIKIRTNGYAFNKTLKGHFTIYGNRKVLLFIKKGNPPYIHILTDKNDIYLNFEESRKTITLYEELKKQSGR